jgi:hypothetical protein
MSRSLTATPAASRRRSLQTLTIPASLRSITSSDPTAKTRSKRPTNCGRRWYHLRPEPRGRADFIGFNYTWWLI